MSDFPRGRAATEDEGRETRLILFDIDGTLLSCGPQVRPIFASALTDVYGTAGDLDGFDFSGKTDPSIVLELMLGAGLGEEEVWRKMKAVRDLYCMRLEEGLAVEGMRLLPGVTQLLMRLAVRGEVEIGILTGNWRSGAMTKLSRFDLDSYFEFGSYGDDGVARAELVPVALERAQRLRGRSFSPSETLIVGDSVRDVSCALDNGARVLAVATGFTSAERLARAGADWVVEDLPSAVRRLPWLREGLEG